MKKTVVALILCAVLYMTAFAQTGNDFKIARNRNGTITIQKYTGKIKDVIIPSTIEGIKVTEIDVLCFDNNITSVTIPDGVTSIGYRAFEGCTSLTSVTFTTGSNITYADFGYDAFPELIDDYSGFHYGGNNLKNAYKSGKARTYTRSGVGTDESPWTWSKQ